LRVGIVVPRTCFPKAVPCHSRQVFLPLVASCVNSRVSYMPPDVAAKKAAMAA